MDSVTPVNADDSVRVATEQGLTPPLNAAIISKLFIAEVRERQLARWVIAIQGMVTLSAAGVVALSWHSASHMALAVLSGGGVSVSNGALLAWRMARMSASPAHEAHLQLRLMFFYAAERFLAVSVLLGICLVVIKLPPLALLSGFVLGQTVLLTARLFLKIRTEDTNKNV